MEKTCVQKEVSRVERGMLRRGIGEPEPTIIIEDSQLRGVSERIRINDHEK